VPPGPWTVLPVPAEAALEAELSDAHRAVERRTGELAARRENTERHGQIERRARLGDIRGRQIDGDALERKLETGVDQRGGDPLPALL
jgi:hypothetical protein